MRQIFFGLKYVVSYPFLKEKKPLICGLVMHNICNLRCKHCDIYTREKSQMSYQEVLNVIDAYYEAGGRTLYYEGGEPMLWSENEYSLDDVINYACNRGFLANIIYTNGTQPLDSAADTIFVSVDGLKKTNDYLRGRSFDKIMFNIQNSAHPSLYINYTINNLNKDEIFDFCEYINQIDQIKGIFFYFHTPYYGKDELYIDDQNKISVLSKLLENKKKFKILNSYAGLKASIKNTWKRPLDICQVYENGKFYKCCRFNDDEKLCEECGYLSYPEIMQVLNLKFSAIRNALKYF